MSNIIKESRKKQGMFQRILAKKIGVSLSTVKRWEKYETYPSYKHLKKLEKVLDINIEDVVKDYIKKT